MSNAQLINLSTYVAMIANVAAGVWLPWYLVILVFMIIHSVIRLSYLKSRAHAESQTAPASVRVVAVVIMSLLLTVILYGVGFGVGYLLGLL